jgi:hypothetical protein
MAPAWAGVFCEFTTVGCVSRISVVVCVLWCCLCGRCCVCCAPWCCRRSLSVVVVAQSCGYTQRQVRTKRTRCGEHHAFLQHMRSSFCRPRHGDLGDSWCHGPCCGSRVDGFTAVVTVVPPLGLAVSQWVEPGIRGIQWDWHHTRHHLRPHCPEVSERALVCGSLAVRSRGLDAALRSAVSVFATCCAAQWLPIHPHRAGDVVGRCCHRIAVTAALPSTGTLRE